MASLIEQKKWISYWKKSLSDSIKTNIDLDKLRNFEILDFDIRNGSIVDLNQVNALIDFEEDRINKKKGIPNRESDNWTTLRNVVVLIAPIKIVPLPDRLIYLKDKAPKFPYWYYAVLDRYGKLGISDELFPIF